MNTNATAAPPQPRPRLPEWLRFQLPVNHGFSQTRALLEELKLHTVCQSAKCPNHWECWSKRTATFMIAGDHCTRACGFCAVSTAKPLPLDAGEPARVAEADPPPELKHVVITAVARDDLRRRRRRPLPPEPSRRSASSIPSTVIEVLVPDFLDNDAPSSPCSRPAPHIYNHNLETVRRLTPAVRHRATYDRSLSVLGKVKARGGKAVVTKSGLMLGLGETEEELFAALADLRRAGCDMLTLGQYLQPTLRHLPVVGLHLPGPFRALQNRGRTTGFPPRRQRPDGAQLLPRRRIQPAGACGCY